MLTLRETCGALVETLRLEQKPRWCHLDREKSLLGSGESTRGPSMSYESDEQYVWTEQSGHQEPAGAKGFRAVRRTLVAQLARAQHGAGLR